MPVEIEWTINLPVPPEKLFEIATKYEDYVNYLPAQIKKITILEDSNDRTVTEETLSFMTILKKEIIQKSVHRKKPNTITTEIISGPFKNSNVVVNFVENNDGSKVEIKADLAIPMKYKIFGLVIRKVYKNYLTSILYKMVNQIQM